MRDTISIYARFLRARIAARGEERNLRGTPERVKSAGVWRDALAWALGIDVDLQERPKSLDLEEIHMAPAITLWRVDLANVDDNADDSADGADAGQKEQPDMSDVATPSDTRWWLLELPPRDHPDGTRTELWSFFLSDAQFRELAECVDAMRGLAPRAPVRVEA